MTVVLSVLAASTSLLATAFGACEARFTVRTERGTVLSRTVRTVCLDQMAADLNRDLANLNGAERHVLLSGSDRFSAANQSAPGELAEFKVKFTPGFQRAPWLITRVRELQIRGGPECGRQFTMHKVAVATEGFTFRLSSQRTCVVESFTGEWLAFAIEPATAFYDLDPKWRKPERPVTPP